MAYLITKFGRPNQPRLQVAGEEVYFPLKMGNNWQTLRVGVLLSLNCVTGSNGLNTVYGVSICRGTKGFYDPAPDDCFAYILGGYPTAGNPALGSIDTTAIPYTVSLTSGGCLYQKRIGYSAATTSANSGCIFPIDWYQPHDYLSAFYIDFDRATTAGSMRALLWAPVSVANARVNKTYPQFLSDMGTASPANMGNPASSTPVSLVYAGTANIFDTVSVFSNITANAVMNVAGVAVARFT